ncbi:MAG: C-terminal helicase domain-containing protein, partial [Deltaproteobacteria bacterium]|nr:C-terminal helicase domain-containing protein [Deltaproteobacteria bacterium]
LYRKLKGVEGSLEYIHGGLDQNTRTSIFNRFKQGRIRLLIATDVAGRGLDFSHVSHIFNYDFPKASENYVHRTGRTGRMGRVGVAISLVTARDLFTVKRLLKEKGIQAAWDGKVPDLGKVVSKKSPSPSGRHPGSRRKTKAPSRS